MSLNNYELYLVDASGNRIAGPLTEVLYLEWSLVLSNVGTCYLEINAADWNPAWFSDRFLLQIWRQPRFQAAPALVQTFWLLDYGKSLQPDDNALVTLRGVDLNAILNWRIVAAAAGSTGANKSGPACEVMRDYAREALFDTYTTAGRGLDLEFALTGEGGVGGPNISYTASRGRLLSVLRGCAGAAITRGAGVRFSIYATANGGTLRIVPTPWGNDQRGGRVFSPEFGTLFEPAWEFRSSEASTYAYAGGQGVEENRLVVEVDLSDGTAIGRRELWAENSQISTAASLQDWARGRLWQARPRLWMGGELRDTELTAFGRDWNLGDLVTCEFDGRTFDAEVLAVTGSVTPEGELIRARVESELYVEYNDE